MVNRHWRIRGRRVREILPAEEPDGQRRSRLQPRNNALRATPPEPATHRSRNRAQSGSGRLSRPPTALTLAGWTRAVTGLYPWIGFKASERVTVWTVAGVRRRGSAPQSRQRGSDRDGPVDGDGRRRWPCELLKTDAGFGLAFKADALWVGTRTAAASGAAGNLQATSAAVTRLRTAIEGSRSTTIGARVACTPSVEVGLRQDGGDAETGTGIDVGSGLVFSDTVTGLSPDVRMRTLLVHQAEGFADRGMSLSFGWDPTPSSPLGLTARVARSWGRSAMGGADALWRGQMAYGSGLHQMYGAGGQVDAEVGYGLPVGARFVGTPRVGLTTSPYGRDYRVGYALGVLDSQSLRFELGVDAQRRESPQAGGVSNGPARPGQHRMVGRRAPTGGSLTRVWGM